MGQNSTQKPHPLQRSRVMNTEPLAIRDQRCTPGAMSVLVGGGACDRLGGDRDGDRSENRIRGTAPVKPEGFALAEVSKVNHRTSGILNCSVAKPDVPFRASGART